MKPTRTFVLRPSLVFFLVAALATPAAAITDEEIFRDFRFNFANPGARALAMGGAYIAIANDATAAQANPARLGILRRPEFFAEGRNRATNASGGSTPTFQIDPSTNPAANLTLDTTVEPQTQTIPSVVSFVYPFKLGHQLTLGISRQEILSVKSSATNNFTSVPLIASPIQGPNPEQVTDRSSGTINSKLDLYNISGGYQITRDLYFGGSIVYGHLNFDSSIDSIFSDPDGLFNLGALDPRFETPQGTSLISTSIHDSATDLKWSFGLFWQFNKQLSFGTVYKKGVRMSLKESVIDHSKQPFVSGVHQSPTDPTTGVGTIKTSFNVPDIEGFGVAFQPFSASESSKLQSLLFALDVVRVENKDIVGGFTPQLNVLTLNDFITRVDYTASTKTEIHVGAEYVTSLGRSTLSFRLGAFTDPDSGVHLVKSVSDGSAEQQGTKAALDSGKVFPTRSTETHITGGFGYAYGDLEFSLAYDSSSIETQTLLSIIYRLKR